MTSQYEEKFVKISLKSEKSNSKKCLVLSSSTANLLKKNCEEIISLEQSRNKRSNSTRSLNQRPNSVTRFKFADISSSVSNFQCPSNVFSAKNNVCYDTNSSLYKCQSLDGCRGHNDSKHKKSKFKSTINCSMNATDRDCIKDSYECFKPKFGDGTNLLNEDMKENKNNAEVLTRLMWKIEKNVMWVQLPNKGKKIGYLLFNCDAIEENLNALVAHKYGMTFKFIQADSKLIRLLLEFHGFREADSSSQIFNLFWGNHFSPSDIRGLHEWQKINHFPRSSELTRKDRLYTNIKRMQRQCGPKFFDFIPTSFVLPAEYRDFCDTQLRERGIWIVKPVASSQGKGIYIVTQSDQVSPDESSLVCRYLEAPLLVDGFKCDLRLYVAVTCLDPLVVYLYEEGLVRLATLKYEPGKNLWNPCIHLTNYSVNKHHSNYVHNEDPEVDDQGNKWSLSAFLRHLKLRGVNTADLMRKIEDVIIKSILSALYQMNTATNMFIPYPRNCFEMFGFDILIDRDLKPWLLEVNLSPSLNVDQPLDLKIKSTMLSHLFSLVGIQVANPNSAKLASRPSAYRKLPNLRSSSDTFERSNSGRFSSHGSNNNRGFLAPSQEELKLFQQLQQENERRGGWVRIFPTPDTWAIYGNMQEYSSPLNLIFHKHLFPNVPRSTRYTRASALRNVSSHGLSNWLERLASYEKSLQKTTPAWLIEKLCPVKRKDTEGCTATKVGDTKTSLKNALENGLTLSKYQARMAFSVYLQHIQRRLMIGSDEEQQTDLVCRFLKAASRTLQLPFNVQIPPRTLPCETRAVVISKQLGDFIQAYSKETSSCLQVNLLSNSLSPDESYFRTQNLRDSSQLSINELPACDNAINLKDSFSVKNFDRKQSYLTDLHDGSESNNNEMEVEGVRNVSDYSNFSQESKNNNLVSTSSGLNANNAFVSSGLTAKPSNNAFVSSGLTARPPNNALVSSGLTDRPPQFPLSSCSPNLVNIDKAKNKFGVFQDKLRQFYSDASPTFTSKSDKILNNIYNVSQNKKLKDTKVRNRNVKTSNSLSSSSDVPVIIDKKTKDFVDTKNNSRDKNEIKKSGGGGITMELYKSFLSNAKESDLEEILNLHTKIHKSAGVFLDPLRRRTMTTPNLRENKSKSSFSSPHGSPRKCRKNLSLERYGSRNILTKNCDGGADENPSQENSNNCSYVFANILKASLQGISSTL